MSMLSGLNIAALVILSLIVVVLALSLIKARWPTSKAGELIAAAETEARTAGVRIDDVFHDVENGLSAFASNVEPMIAKAEIGVDKELASMMSRLEARLLDTRAEDAVIAEAQANLERVTAQTSARIALANQAKLAKLDAMRAHVSALQSAIGQAPAA